MALWNTYRCLDCSTVTDSNSRSFNSSKSISVCQIKLIAKVWLTLPAVCAGRFWFFFPEEIIYGIDLVLQNEHVFGVSFPLFPPRSFSHFIPSHIHYGNDILSAFSKQDSVLQVAEQKFSASVSTWINYYWNSLLRLKYWSLFMLTLA